METLAVTDLAKYYGKTKAVDGISFAVSAGEIFGFLGPNGAGKTTSIRCIMDFIRPTKGAITILGKDAHTDGVQLKKKIGFLSGYVRLYDKWTGHDHIALAKKLTGGEDIAKELISRLDFDPTLKTKQLSSGNRQKLGIILALMSKPEIIIMDEPTNALDPILQNEVYKLLQEATERGATVFMSSHNLAEVNRVCHRVAVIKNGKIVATESILELKRKSLYTARIGVGKETAMPSFDPSIAEVIQRMDHTLVVKVKGNINDFVGALAKIQLHDVEIEHASLDEIFLEYYQ